MRKFGKCWIQDSSIVAMAIALIIPGEVFAQTAAPQGDQGGIAEIVVTAQRREQNLQDVGVSVIAVSGADLRKRNIIDSKDIVRVAAGVLLENGFGGGATNASLSVRGVSQTDLSPNQEGPNSLYPTFPRCEWENLAILAV